MIKTLGKTSWDKIKVGEVFATNSCWIIGIKITEDSFRLLAEDYTFDGYCRNKEGKLLRGFNPSYNLVWKKNKLAWEDAMDNLYKLSLATQRKWRQE